MTLKLSASAAPKNRRMDHATQTLLKELLLQRQRELLAEVRSAAARRQATDAPREVEDRKDEAERAEEAEVDAAQEQRDLDELEEVEAALSRLAAGRYGDCAACREPIAGERLRVQPAARLCAGCQADHERHRN